ncbi:MAG: hypothetical protein ACXWE6_08465 [Nitrososphaeraceae archaeon]
MNLHHVRIVKLDQSRVSKSKLSMIDTSCMALIIVQYPRGKTTRSGTRPIRIPKMG